MQITIRMPDEYVIQIDNIAKKMSLKRSDITRMAIYQFLNNIGMEHEDTPLFDKAKGLIGIAESGTSDLGQNHRQHLINQMKTKK